MPIFRIYQLPEFSDFSNLPISRTYRSPEFPILSPSKNCFQSIRKFIEDELKSCARKDVYVKRLGRLADNIKINAPVLTKPPKRKGKKGKKGKRRG